MKKNEKKLIAVTEEMQISRPTTREMLAVDKTDWERIVRLVKKINMTSNRWENGGWFMSATTIAVFLEFITHWNERTRSEWGIATIFCLILTLFSFIVALKFSKIENSSKEDVIFEMEQIKSEVLSDKGESLIQPDDFQVLEAIYGTSAKNINIAQNLNDHIKDNKLNIIVSNDIGGDPAPHFEKDLKIKYRYQDGEYEKIFQEGDTIDLP